jgi:bud emergence protein 1
MYWYIIECQLEDGRWFELSRYYADFYDLQIALIEAFPVEAGNRNKQRTLPFMPGPVAHVTDAISNGRRQNLDEYIKQIIAMPPHISKSTLVRNLFRPKPGQDFEIDPNALNDDYRLSSGSQQSLQRTQSNQPGGASRESSNPQMAGGYGGMGPPPVARTSHQRQQPSMSGAVGGGGYGGLMSPPPHPNGGPDRPYLQSQPSNLTQTSQNSGGQGQQQQALRVKCTYLDETIVVRLPADVGFREFVDKIQGRLKVEPGRVLAFRWEDQRTGQMMEIRGDVELDEVIERNGSGQLRVFAS